MNDTFRTLSDTDAAAEARRLIDTAYRPEPEPQAPTSYRDTTEVPKVGDTPPVPQPDHRLVPQWAAGAAVVSVAGGAGCTGIGCGFWLMFNGASSVTAAGVAALLAPFLGIAAVIITIGVTAARLRAAAPAPTTTHHHYEGDVHQHTEHHTTTHNRGLFTRTVNQQPHN